MSEHIPKEKWTFKKKALWVNKEGARCIKGCGGIHRYMTLGCKPVMIPDHWTDEFTWRRAPLWMRLTRGYSRMGSYYEDVTPRPETPSPAKIQT